MTKIFCFFILTAGAFSCTERNVVKTWGNKRYSPPELDANQKTNCVNNYKATRILFVVDNSGSNGLKDGSIQSPPNYVGTDPVRKGKSARGIEETYTDRQNTIYDIFLHTMDLDSAALKTNPGFTGSEIGVVSFPKSEQDLSSYQNITGVAGSSFPDAMTGTKTIANNAEKRTALWDALSFTYKPEGATPYYTALQAVDDYLVKTKAADDSRESIALLITDGLPTDEQPSKVRELRQSLGSKIALHILSVYRPGADINAQNSEAASALKVAFDTQNWGRRPGASDGFSTFDDYWKALLAIPAQIGDKNIDVTDSAKLLGEVNALLKVEQTCH